MLNIEKRKFDWKFINTNIQFNEIGGELDKEEMELCIGNKDLENSFWISNRTFKNEIIEDKAVTTLF